MFQHPFKLTKQIALGIILLFWLFFLFSRTPVYKPEEVEYGITFSKKQSQSLGLDWQKNYLDMLDDLGVKRIRLAAYWDEVQPENNRFNWDDLDWQINEAEKRNVSIILVMGNRVPRWPECHIPTWVNDLETDERQTLTIDYIRETITRYHHRPTITHWQVENEPFLKYFGICPPFDKNFLDQEIALVRSLDSRPIIVTDSGELSTWIPAAKRGDVFGSTLYVYTYTRALDRYIRYPISHNFFRVKKNVTNLFAHPQDWMIIELQGEPWGKEAFQNISQEEREITMSPAKFKEITELARKTGFRIFYWWGVEYWYWEKQRGNDFYWQEAKRLIQQGQ